LPDDNYVNKCIRFFDITRQPQIILKAYILKFAELFRKYFAHISTKFCSYNVMSKGSYKHVVTCVCVISDYLSM